MNVMFFATTVCFLLVGCSPSMQDVDRINKNGEASCTQQGYSPGTQAFATCMSLHAGSNFSGINALIPFRQPQ